MKLLFEEIMNTFKKHEKEFKWIFLIVESLSILWFFYAIFFIDSRWWIFIIFLAIIIFLLYYLYKQELYEQPLRLIIREVTGWFAVYSCIFIIICAAFITSWWFFGLTIPITLFFIWRMLSLNENGEYISYNNSVVYFTKTRKLTLIIVTVMFSITFCLFCIPSFVANSNRLPLNQYNNSPPKIYVLYGGDFASFSFDREHVYAQSWFKVDGSIQNKVNDLHNVIWSNQTVNRERGNSEFGYGKNKYEPEDEWKGDIARAILYMYVTYGDCEGFDKSKINIGLMKTWSKIDPVSDEERALNEWIKTKSIQKNSNPFIDNPWLVGFVA